MEICIRLAKTEEIEGLIDLQTLSILGLPSHFREYNEMQINSIAKGQAEIGRKSLHAETVLVAEDRERNLVGFASLSNHLAQINGIYVHPDFIGKGIGTKLLQKIENICISRFLRKHGHEVESEKRGKAWESHIQKT